MQLCVTPARFAEQMSWLKAHGLREAMYYSCRFRSVTARRLSAVSCFLTKSRNEPRPPHVAYPSAPVPAVTAAGLHYAPSH